MPWLAVSRDPAALAELNAETVFMPGDMEAPRLRRGYSSLTSRRPATAICPLGRSEKFVPWSRWSILRGLVDLKGMPAAVPYERQ
jgi:hypothetical protein